MNASPEPRSIGSLTAVTFSKPPVKATGYRMPNAEARIVQATNNPRRKNKRDPTFVGATTTLGRKLSNQTTLRFLTVVYTCCPPGFLPLGFRKLFGFGLFKPSLEGGLLLFVLFFASFPRSSWTSSRSSLFSTSRKSTQFFNISTVSRRSCNSAKRRTMSSGFSAEENSEKFGKHSTIW